MQITPAHQFSRQPWKNGGGITHEIARLADGPDLIWRLSMAEVATDGPFSAFPGLTRSLTVIEGDGIDLEMPTNILRATALLPVIFSGDTPVHGRLIRGAIRDLNLIFDAARLTATVTPLVGPQNRHEVAAPDGDLLLFCVAGPLRANDQDIPRFALARATQLALRLDTGAAALLIRLSPVDL